MIIDAHTHSLSADNAIIAAQPTDFAPQPGRLYSIGIHPWNTDQATEAHMALLQQCARHPQVVAIGETGLDSLRGASLERQTAIFEQHISLAQQLHMPLIIHCVRTSQQVLALHRQLAITVPCAIHGMRSNHHVAQALLDAGFYLSFGPRFNLRSIQATPLDRLLIETDDSGQSITQVAQAIAPTLSLDTNDLLALAARNLNYLIAPNDTIGDGSELYHF